ncbi:MAG TPA: trigger factor [Candidatus Paceibacterota bacterium]|nr:trigger factor [Candidatus Paceibacterota bacterium]
MKTTIKKLEKSEVEITGVLEKSEFEKYEEKALERIGERVELQGFRKGKAPASIVKENVQEMELLQEMAECALTDNYVKILEDNKIDAIGRPQIAITKIGKGSDLEFKITTAVLPEVKLPDYKKIASAENKKEEAKKEVVVDEAEVEKTILELRKMRAEQARGKGDHTGHENMTEEEHAKLHENDKKEIPESEYPIFDDAFAKTFGDFKNAEEFKDKIRSNIKTEKETEQKDKIRLAIVEELVKQTKGEIPDILVQSETDKIMYRLQADVTNAGFKMEDYLKQINKTEDDLRNEWKGEAEKRAMLQMIIHTISEKENLKPTEEEIEKDVTQITAMYKDADPTRARAYVEQMLENEKVFTFLEKQ